MKRFFSLSALLLSITFLLFNSNSFTTAEINNETTLSLVSEEDALIAINYKEEEMFTVTNNTGKTIDIESIQLLSSSANNIRHAQESDSLTIGPGESKAFTITEDPTHLYGNSIQLMVRWNDGSAVIQSLIPEFYIEQLVRKSEEDEMELELLKGQVASQLCVENPAIEIDKEIATPDIDEEKTTPEINVEKSNPELCKEVTQETEVEITIPELNDAQTISEIQPKPPINDKQ